MPAKKSIAKHKPASNYRSGRPNSAVIQGDTMHTKPTNY